MKMITAGAVLLASLGSAPAMAVSAIFVSAAASGNTAGFYSLAVSYFSPTGLSVADSGPLNGNIASYSPTTAATGLTALTVAAAVNGSQSAASQASASLSTGKVGIKAGTSPTFNSSGSGRAELYDDLTFSVAGGGSGQVTVVSRLDGSIGAFANANSLSGLSYNLNFGASNFSYVSQGSQAGFTFNTGTPSGWDSFGFTNVTATGFDFTGTFTVNNGDMRSVTQRLYLICQEGADCDFSQTGSVGLQLAAGVSFTSGSGTAPAGGAARRRRGVVAGRH
jgi:hypothetical protein